MYKREKRVEDVFLALLIAGLWEKGVQLSSYDPIDFSAVYELAEKQAVVGLVAAGLEHVEDRNVAKQDVMPFMLKVVATETKNQELNSTISSLKKHLDEEHIVAVLVKGQGIAQTYERPLWRSPGDIDLLLDSENYTKAKSVLTTLAKSVQTEKRTKKHLGMSLSSAELELHGTLHSELSDKLDSVVDNVQDEMFRKCQFREWRIEDTTVFLPSPDNDIIFVFSHILQHFYKGGIGLRQICDWCRLLWTYKAEINIPLLEQRLKQMGVLSEWVGLSSLAVEFLGIPKETIPLFKKVYPEKGKLMLDYILEAGNFGHNRDNSYQRRNYPILLRKAISFWRIIKDYFRLFKIFPKNSIRFFFGLIHSKFED